MAGGAPGASWLVSPSLEPGPVPAACCSSRVLRPAAPGLSKLANAASKSALVRSLLQLQLGKFQLSSQLLHLFVRRLLLLPGLLSCGWIRSSWADPFPHPAFQSLLFLPGYFQLSCRANPSRPQPVQLVLYQVVVGVSVSMAVASRLPESGTLPVAFPGRPVGCTL
ncbi:hypothetical protein R1flu_028051 [Riccia fluitans]|uniref:Uncharacterized protein n=1 Tax=Riccia fluitans TaxID=41844 RepID=A0ABD1XPL1_9MARC